MKSTFNGCLLLSLVVHLVVCLVVRYDLAPAEEETIVPIEVEKLILGRGAETRGSRAGGRSNAKRLRLSDLMLSPGELSSMHRSGTESDDPSVPPAGSVLGALRHSVLFDHLFERIDAAFYYPDEFKEASIQGEANAEIELTRNGEDIEVFYRVRSKSAYVRVFVIQRLREIFGRGVTARYIGSARRVLLKATFHLELIQSDAAVSKTHGGIYGTNLSFYRSAKAFGEWSLGPIRGYGIAPSVAIDPSWLVKQYKNMVGKGPVEEPLLKYRNDPAWRAD